MYCSKCGQETNSQFRFCQSCGADLDFEENVQAGHSQQPVTSNISETPLSNKASISISNSESSVDQSKTFSKAIHHPWRRFFARTVDFLFLGSLIWLVVLPVIGFLFPQIAEIFDNVLVETFTIYILWLFAEAAFLAVIGTTPAKWIFGISVIGNDGKTLSYFVALKRAFLVFYKGEGLLLPIISFFTLFFAYKRLTKTGTTLWDKSVDSVVTHKKWGVIRAIVCSFFIVLILSWPILIVLAIAIPNLLKTV